ncbi:MAG TPA: hypothetical protein C5S50_10930 [Methanosarcinaceae archaeon]|nr:hypothetical protein [Methanosarcinaceae archaeon]
MKRLKFIGVVVMLIAMCTCAHSASAAPVVSVEPGSIEVKEGETFTVDIMIDPAGSEIMGAQYNLYFDNALVSATEQVTGDFLGGIGMLDNINNTIGMIMYGEMRTNVNYGVNTSGILATITFNATGHGVCDLTLGDVILSDKDAKAISGVVIHDGTCNIAPVESPPLPVSPTTPTTSTPITAPAQTPTEVETTENADTTTTDNPVPPLPKPDQTATSSTPAPIHAQQPDEDGTANQSGFASAFLSTVMLVVSYLILRKSE